MEAEGRPHRPLIDSRHSDGRLSHASGDRSSSGAPHCSTSSASARAEHAVGNAEQSRAMPLEIARAILRVHGLKSPKFTSHHRRARVPFYDGIGKEQAIKSIRPEFEQSSAGSDRAACSSYRVSIPSTAKLFRRSQKLRVIACASLREHR